MLAMRFFSAAINLRWPVMCMKN